MYEVKRKERCVDYEKITTYQREVFCCNVLEVEAGSNGYHGGDSGHGSRTYFRIADLGGTDMEVHSGTDKYGQSYFEVILGGDSELRTIIEALEFITQCLKDEVK